MRNRLTKLEILAASKPRIISVTRMALDKGKSSASISQHLNKCFQLHTTKSTIEKFRVKVWRREREELAQQKSDYEAGAELIQQHGLDKAAQALLFQQVRHLNPTHLLSILRLKLERQKLSVARKALKQRAGEVETLPTNTPEEVKAAHHKVSNAIRNIFGLGEVGEDGIPLEETPIQVDAEERRLKSQLEMIERRRTLALKRAQTNQARTDSAREERELASQERSPDSIAAEQSAQRIRQQKSQLTAAEQPAVTKPTPKPAEFGIIGGHP